MQIGDLVRHQGGSGWEVMKGEIGLVVVSYPSSLSDHPMHTRWLIQWCTKDIPRFYRDFKYWQDHLEVISAKR